MGKKSKFKMMRSISKEATCRENLKVSNSNNRDEEDYTHINHIVFKWYN